MTLHFSTPQFTGLWAILGTTYIMQASVANQIAQNPTMQITHPVGTGPFELDSYSTSLIKFKPNPHYWGGTPPESEVEVPSVATNAAASDALVSQQLDWAGNDIPNIYASFVNLDPQTNHAWFASGSTVALRFNLNPGNGGATGINDVAVRKAVSYGIDRNALALLGELGYEVPATSSGGLILPAQKAFLPTDGSLTNDLSTTGNVPDAATAKTDKLPAGDDVYDILTAGGWKAPASSSYNSGSGTYKSGGNCDGSNVANCWTKGSEIIKFSVYDPVPFSDYWEDASLISQELQALGHGCDHQAGAGVLGLERQYHRNPFRVADRDPLGPGWADPIHPVRGLARLLELDHRCARRGISNATAEQTCRPTPAPIPPIPRRFIPPSSQLEKIMSTDVPEAPLLYGADWNVYSSAKYVGWPDQSQPYMDPSPSDPQMPYILMQLKPVA